MHTLIPAVRMHSASVFLSAQRHTEDAPIPQRHFRQAHSIKMLDMEFGDTQCDLNPVVGQVHRTPPTCHVAAPAPLLRQSVASPTRVANTSTCDKAQ
jgi:hypothetical protein